MQAGKPRVQLGEGGSVGLLLLAGLAYLEGEGPARNVRALLFCAQQSFTFHVTMSLGQYFDSKTARSFNVEGPSVRSLRRCDIKAVIA